MTSPTRHPDLLRVADPSTRNTQQLPRAGATGDATAAQRSGLKALALKALERNSERNTPAPRERNIAQQPLSAEVASVAPVAFPKSATTQQPRRSERAVVRFQLPGTSSNTWCAAIGACSRAELVADVLLRWPDAEVLP
jgi:hypothetical protein